MNLIDFHVTEIISEERNKVWKLYGMSEKELEKRKKVKKIGGLNIYYLTVLNRNINIGMMVENLLEKMYSILQEEINLIM